MPFRYDQYHPALTDTIAARIANQGAIEAQRAQSVGNAWAGAIQNIGQSVAQIPGQIQQQKEQALRQQIGQQQVQQGAINLDQAQQANEARDLFKATIKTTPMVKEQGMDLYDIPAISQRLGAAGMDPSPFAKNLAELNDSFRSFNAARQSVVVNGAQKIAAAGNDPDLALHFLDSIENNGVYSKDQIGQFRQLIQQGGQPAVEKLTAYLMGPQKGEVVPAGASVVNPVTQKPMYTAPEKPMSVAPGASLVNPQTGATVFQAPEKQTANEWKDVLLDGKPAKVFVDPKTRTVTTLGGQVVDNADARIKPVPPASVQINNTNRAGAPGDYTKTGDEFLQTVPAQWRQTVKKIANYDEDPTKVASMRGGMREQLMQWVNQVNPAYDASQFSNRAPTRKAYTTGTQGQQINALNTAIGHLDQLIPIAEKLNNGSFVPGNEVMNRLSSMFGSQQVTNFETLKDALAGEVASVLSKGAATVSGIQAEKEKIKGASSPQQLAGYVKTLIPLLGSKLSALDYQYHQAMGPDDAFSALSPTSKSTLARYGFDPSSHPGGGDSAGVSVTSPSGKTFTFKTQADADKAVSAAKSKGLWK
jgi:hypothetical protein